MVAAASWVQRRDPGLITVRRAVRVATVACIGFYVCEYVVHNSVLATYALFSAVAMGFLSQLPGPAIRQATTALWTVPVACVLVTIGSLIAGNLWVATAGMLVFGFLIAYAGVGGPRLVGLTAGLQLLFILPGFPPYAPDTLLSRLAGVAVGIGLLALAELWMWPDPAPVSGTQRLAEAADALAALLSLRANEPDSPEATRVADRAETAAEAIRPSRLPPEARPASAGRHDRALSHAGGLLRFALARLREFPPDPPAETTNTPPDANDLLRAAARTSADSAQALRGGALPQTAELTQSFAALRRERRESPTRPVPADARAVTIALVIGDAIWAMATAIRVSRGAAVEVGHGTRRVRRDRFPYAYAGPIGLWWQRFVVHLTPRSVYFQQAVRVAVALAVARLVAGGLELSHGFWVLLATLTLLRSRAADTRIALRPAVIGTVSGAAVAAILLLLIGDRTSVYAALLPPIMVVAFAAGVLLGPAWGQALFTVVVTFVFTQLAPAGVSLAGARVTDVLIGAVIGVGAGILAWPRGAGGEMRRSAATFLSAGGDLVRETTRVLTGAQPATSDGRGDAAGTAPAQGGANEAPPPSTADLPGIPGPSAGAVAAPSVGAVVSSGPVLPRVKEAMQLADATYCMYQAERHTVQESTVDWQAILVAGHHIMRGSELLRDTYTPGVLAPWRDLVDDSASRVDEACGRLADAIQRGRDPRPEPVAVTAAPDSRVIDVQTWLAGIGDDLTRVTARR